MKIPEAEKVVIVEGQKADGAIPDYGKNFAKFLKARLIGQEVKEGGRVQVAIFGLTFGFDVKEVAPRPKALVGERTNVSFRGIRTRVAKGMDEGLRNALFGPIK